MNNRILLNIILILLLISNYFIALAQVTMRVGVPHLLISASPESNGQGCTSVSRITDDPFAINSNPAHLGISSFKTGGIIGFYPSTSKAPLGSGFDDFTYNSYVLTGGINLEDYVGMPISIGFAYTRVYLDLGTFVRMGDIDPTPLGTFQAEEHSDAFSFGIGLDINLKLAAGVTFRRTVSNFSPFGSAREYWVGIASIWSGDIGILIYAPIVDIVNIEYELIPKTVPIIDISFGTAYNNIGRKLTYIDEAQSDPLPRSLSMGITLEFGIKLNKTGHKLATLSWSRESDDLLVGWNQQGSLYYQDIFGDVNFFKNIIGGTRTTRTENGASVAATNLLQGWQLGFGEFFYYRRGSFEGIDNSAFSTSGFGFRLSGIFKIIQDISDEEIYTVSFLLDHFDFRYDESNYDLVKSAYVMPFTKFSSFNFIIKF
jgi:hypothetical protein